MTRILLAAAAVAALATAAQAQGLAQVPSAGAPGHGGPDYDANHDGKVTLEEFQAGQARRLDRIFQRLDTDHDGKLSKDELAAGAQGKGGHHVERLQRLAGADGGVTRAQLDALAEKRFRAADTNHDGWLSADEVSNMRQRMRGGQSPE